MSVAKSPECIAPSAFDSTERQQSAKVGIFNLISTMIGGGVLSLPFAVSRAGLVLGFVMLTLSAMTSVFSFDILVSSARRTGAMTYQQIGYFAFGPRLQSIITFLLWCLTYLASIGYCILVGDLIKPIICFIGSISEVHCGEEWLRRIVIAFGILSVSPFCYMRQIKALKYTSIVSIASVIILAGIITLKTVKQFGERHEMYYINDRQEMKSFWIKTDIRLFPQTVSDIIYVFPVYFLSFMCHFNIPQVHSELTRPTRKRMRIVLVTVVSVCYVLYAIVAFFGYFYSFGYTCGNILLNYDQNDVVINIARLSLGFVILFTFPLLILPARSALHNLLNLCFTFENMNILEDETLIKADVSFSNSDSQSRSGDEDNVSLFKAGMFGESDSSDGDTESIEEKTNVIFNQSLMGAPAMNANVGNIGYALFSNPSINNSENKVKDSITKMGNENKLQVLNKLTPSIGSSLISPSEYSRSTVSLLSQRQCTTYSYNTFSPNHKLMHKKPKMYGKINAPKSKSTTDLLLGIFKSNSARDSPNSSSKTEKSVSTTRGFTTRSFSHLDSPLRGPQDVLGTINEPKDIIALRQMDFAKAFQNLENAKNYRPTQLWLIGETTLLIGLSLLISFLTDSIMVLWGIVGSTVTFVVAFTLPGAFYFKIRFHRKGWTMRNVLSLMIVIVSCVAIIGCTWQALMRLDAKPCPNQPYASNRT